VRACGPPWPGSKPGWNACREFEQGFFTPGKKAVEHPIRHFLAFPSGPVHRRKPQPRKSTVKIVQSLAALTFTALLCSCAGSKPFPTVPPPEKVAVVTFELWKTVETSDGKKSGLENPIGNFMSDSSQYEDLQNALDSVWAKFKVGLPKVSGYQLVPTEEIVANAKYQELTKRDPLIPGKDIFNSYLVPRGGLQQVNWVDTTKLHAISDALGVKKLLLVESTASLDGGFSVGGVGSTNMALHSNFRLFEPGKGVYWTTWFSGVSEDGAAMLANSIPHSAYPKLLPQTVKPILEKMAKVNGGVGAK
jgi:hypothetical protein